MARMDMAHPFMRGYVEALLFTDCGPDSDDLTGATVDDFAPETVARIATDCAAFMERASLILPAAYCCDYTEEQAGRDFWLTRNGHGAGFWDRSELVGNIGDRLSVVARTFGECWTYRGDDGRVYLG